jgi:hypothetical protein
MERLGHGGVGSVGVGWRLPRAQQSMLELSFSICIPRLTNSSGLERRPKQLIPVPTRKKNQKNLDKAMQKLLENYPPK